MERTNSVRWCLEIELQAGVVHAPAAAGPREVAARVADNAELRGSRVHHPDHSTTWSSSCESNKGQPLPNQMKKTMVQGILIGY